MYLSHLTPEEAYRTHGTVDSSQLEYLLDIDNALINIETELDNINSCFECEYFLLDPINDLNRVINNIDSKHSIEILKSVVTQLKDAQLRIDQGRGQAYEIIENIKCKVLI